MNSPASTRAAGAIRARFEAPGGRTQIARMHESGGLRLRHPRAAQGCEAVIVNTGGGVLGGDTIDVRFEIGVGADVTLTTQAAEKIYRTDGALARITTTLNLATCARLDWLPQETILFDQARLLRRLDVEMASDARLLLVEALVFGRLAKGETSIRGLLRDVWRIRRGGRLVLAEDMRLDGAIGAALDRPAVGGGARATAIVVFIAPDAEAALDRLRAALEGAAGVEHGASAWNGLLVARLASPSPERVRAAIVRVLVALRGRDPPRVWQ